jgi:hypothetical protein
MIRSETETTILARIESCESISIPGLCYVGMRRG